jgi:tripartite-type tricarboxylate transporter receptor subunit TctC
MRIPRILALALAVVAMPAAAQEAWPSRPIHLIVPSAPGGAADTSARVVAERLGVALGQTVIVENRSGGGGTVAGSAVVQSRPDGYTLLIDSTVSQIVNPLIMRGMPYDPHRALVPVSQATRIPVVLVTKRDLPTPDTAAFLAYARAHPGALSCGTARSGTASHLVGALLQLRAGIQITDVQYRGGSEASRDVLAGTLDCGYVAIPNVLSMMQGDRIRMLAVASGKRSALLPQVATLGEAGLADAVLDETYGLFAPVGTPATVIGHIATRLRQALSEPEARAQLAAMGAEATPSTPEEFAASFAQDRKLIEALVRDAHIEIQ